jgi:hypothetical protein
MSDTSGYSEKPHPDLERGVHQLARKLKRDFFIAGAFFVLFAALDQFTSWPLVGHLATTAFCWIFASFLFRLYRFCKASTIDRCPDCGGKLEQESHHDGRRELVCHPCRAIFLRYRPSRDPDRMFEVD